MPDIGEMLQQVQRMQAGVAAARDQLRDELVDGSAGNGLVRVTLSGSGDVRAVSLAPEVVDPDDVEMLEDLVTAAFADAQRRVGELQAQRLQSATGGLDLGGFGDLLG